ncbi:MAG: hydantoinase/oxoprolinase family protein, partial [Rhodospirillales bacterium]|nr:hydantoinase/oxoprolinase family protein [Rhodospirillales bacterium]
APTTERRIAFMRYVGQGHEIPVPLPPGRPDAEAIRAAYTEAYRRFYDRPVPGSDIEIMSYAVLVATETDPPAPAAPEPGGIAGPPPAARQAVVDTASGTRDAWAVYPRAALAPGMRIAGPAIVTEAATSTLVPVGWTAMIARGETGAGWIVLSRAANTPG